jgi:hypothetical protein
VCTAWSRRRPCPRAPTGTRSDVHTSPIQQPRSHVHAAQGYKSVALPRLSLPSIAIPQQQQRSRLDTHTPCSSSSSSPWRSAASAPLDYPSAKPSTTWANTDASLTHHVTYSDGSVARAALLRLNPARYGPSFAFGFFCTNHRGSPPCADFLLGVAVVYCNSGGGMTSVTTGIPQVVWSADRGRPVGEGATAQLTASGNLVLKSADGEAVWSRAPRAGPSPASASAPTATWCCSTGRTRPSGSRSTTPRTRCSSGKRSGRARGSPPTPPPRTGPRAGSTSPSPPTG